MINENYTYRLGKELTNKTGVMWCEECNENPKDKIFRVHYRGKEQRGNREIIIDGTIWMCSSCVDREIKNVRSER